MMKFKANDDSGYIIIFKWYSFEVELIYSNTFESHGPFMVPSKSVDKISDLLTNGWILLP